MRVQITIKIKKAISSLLSDKDWTFETLGKEIKVSQEAISQWLNGNTKSISMKAWERLEPLLLPYLPAEYRNTVYMTLKEGEDNFRNKVSEASGGFVYHSAISPPLQEAAPLSASAFTAVTVITMASAATFDPIYDPMDDMINASVEECSFPNVKPGMVAIRVEGDSMSPTYPNGSVLLVDTANPPKRGDPVVARLKDIGIVFKYYNRKDNIVHLTSDNSNGQTFKWNVKENREFCFYMWPVISAFTSPRQQRWENLKINGKSK